MMHSDSEFVNLRDVIETLCYMVGEDSDGVEEVMQLPSIDIVRCGECRYFSVISDEEEGTNYYMCGVWSNATDEDAFCSYGKRSE